MDYYLISIRVGADYLDEIKFRMYWIALIFINAEK